MTLRHRLLRALGVSDAPATEHAPVPERTTRSLAAEVVIALTDPEKGTRSPAAGYAVAVALLLELAHEGRLEVRDTGRSTRVTVRDTTPFGDPELDSALPWLEVGGAGQKIARSVWVLVNDGWVARHLLDRGLLVEQQPHRRLWRRIVGVVVGEPFTPLPTQHPTPAAGRDELVARIRGVLLGESVPDERTALLVAALRWGRPHELFVPKDRAEEASRRVDEIIAGIGDDGLALISAVDVHAMRQD